MNIEVLLESLNQKSIDNKGGLLVTFDLKELIDKHEVLKEYYVKIPYDKYTKTSNDYVQESRLRWKLLRDFDQEYVVFSLYKYPIDSCIERFEIIVLDKSENTSDEKEKDISENINENTNIENNNDPIFMNKYFSMFFKNRFYKQDYHPIIQHKIKKGETYDELVSIYGFGFYKQIPMKNSMKDLTKDLINEKEELNELEENDLTFLSNFVSKYQCTYRQRYISYNEERKFYEKITNSC